MNKLHIGCGHDYKEGYINVDIDPNVKTDWCGDASYMPDIINGVFIIDYFDHIYSHHSLEHFHDLFEIVDEMARVSKDGATWIHTVPYCTWTQGWGNPHHKILFHENTFRFFDKGPNGIHKRREQDYSIETVKVEYGWNDSVVSQICLLNSYRGDLGTKRGYVKDKHLNVVRDITFHLKVNK